MSDPIPSEVLQKARDLIEAHGWIQLRLGTPADGFCMVGALYHAGNGFNHPDDRLFKERRYLHLAIQELAGYPYSIPTFNDRPGRTKEDALAIYDWAIEEAKEEEAKKETVA